ncbi:hypothetical protein BZA05DRAFT_414932 [Tricharina praecox]|uniref:uncharacterized protein n=1 Tax=Tricharina praecox TaxID=43433 RepID=UPI00222098FA|nr:uncharacterized protein BZA05DRAFT_414932 [Tricharina praecox]KAI5859236.1 hypothetical protein BZA05DRAFT_414932 [Tricharina praecox]
MYQPTLEYHGIVTTSHHIRRTYRYFHSAELSSTGRDAIPATKTLIGYSVASSGGSCVLAVSYRFLILVGRLKLARQWPHIHGELKCESRDDSGLRATRARSVHHTSSTHPRIHTSLPSPELGGKDGGGAGRGGEGGTPRGLALAFYFGMPVGVVQSAKQPSFALGEERERERQESGTSSERANERANQRPEHLLRSTYC